MRNTPTEDNMSTDEPGVELDNQLSVSNTPLLNELPSSQVETSERPSLPVRRKLYRSHFLSTWNSRVFEFGAVLFLSTIFPGTLLPASVYALARAASIVLFSGFVGHFIDHGDRMHVVRVSISRCTSDDPSIKSFGSLPHTCITNNVKLAKEWEQPYLAGYYSSWHLGRSAILLHGSLNSFLRCSLCLRALRSSIRSSTPSPLKETG